MQMYNPYLQPSFPVVPMQTEIQKVNGKESANAFPLMPNSSIILLDIKDPLIYVVVSDASGYKTVSTFDVIPHVEQEPADQFQLLSDRIAKIEERMTTYESYHGTTEPVKPINAAGERIQVYGEPTGSSEPDGADESAD